MPAGLSAAINIDSVGADLDENWPVLNYLENEMILPLNDMFAVASDAFGLTTIGKGAVVLLGILVLYITAIINIAIMTLMFIEFQAIKYLLGAFGPLVVFAWVFEQTRPAAWTAIKLLIQSSLPIFFFDLA